MSQSDSAAFMAGYPLKAHNTFGFDVARSLRAASSVKSN